VIDSLELLLSFYGRWIIQWDQNLADVILHSLSDNERNLVKMYWFIESMNHLASSRPDDVRATLRTTFQRDEFVSQKQVLRIIKHMFAYEHLYLTVDDNSALDDSLVLRCPEETKKLILKAKEFITYLKTGVSPEELEPTTGRQTVTISKPPIVPEIVRVQRRMTMVIVTTKPAILNLKSEPQC
jgi:hypothetical protein